MNSTNSVNSEIKHKKRLLKVVGVTLLVFFLGYFGYHLAYRYPLPEKDKTQAIVSPKTYGYQTFEEIPKNLVDTIVFIEDKRFWKHRGVDTKATVRAIYQTFFKNKTQGASTIDQQTIKLSESAFKRTGKRKIYEIRMAKNLQFHYTKQQILLAYINTIPFSHGIQGRNAACSIYFHKGCEHLSTSELSYLLATSQLGSNPYKQSNQLKILARAQILCQLLDEETACKNLETIELYPYEAEIDPKIQLFLNSLPTEQQNSFDIEQYKRIENILATTKDHREVYDAQHCCVVAVNQDGGIISMNTCSSREDEEDGRVNSCTDPRQVGSAIKPFLYTYAFQKGATHINDTIVDEPVSFDLGDGSTYSPKNFDLQYRGEVLIPEALGNSLNVPAIKILYTVGVDSFLQFLKSQLSTYAPGQPLNDKNADNVGLSLALGTYEITPYAFTQLRRMFINGYAPVYENQQYNKATKEIVTILSNPLNRAAAFGQDSFLNLPGRAVKTGTSRKFIDARVCGVQATQGTTLCLWMGNINNLSMKGPSSEIGSYIWNIIAKGL